MWRVSDVIILRPFEQERFRRLVELARDRFDTNLTQAEVSVMMYSAAAYPLPEPPPTEERPPVRPDFLRWLMTDSEAAKFTDPKGVRLWSITIPAPLDLQGCTVLHPLHILWSTIEAELYLFTAEMKGLYIFGGILKKGLLADGIKVHGPIFIKRTKIAGMIRLIGAEITRNLDMTGSELTGGGMTLILDGARISGSVFLHNGFRASGEIRMLNTRIGGDLGFNGATVKATGRALSLDKVVVEGNVSFAEATDGSGKAFHSDGSVNLLAAQVTGDLDCGGANLAATDVALNLTTAKIRGHIYLRNGFKSNGQLAMQSAEVGNSIDLSGATLTDAESAVSLQEASVRGTISMCDGFSSVGRVELPSSYIQGNLVCDNCKLGALYCANMTLKGDLQWTGIQEPEKTSLWLNGATIKTLRDERESWPKPGRLHLDGLRYEELTLHSARTEIDRKNNSLGREHPLKIEDRVAWLQLQPASDQSEPQPWMQLAALLRAKDDENGAKRITFELRRAQARSSSKAMRVWKTAFAQLRQWPIWILLPIFLTTTLATALYWLAAIDGAMAPTSKEVYNEWATGQRMDAAYPRFNPLIYSLENDLPLVKFGLDDKWAPDQTYRPKDVLISYSTLRWTRVILILWGWFQATVLAAAIGSRFRN
jgi:sRNA-binding regulator protein Hfq